MINIGNHRINVYNDHINPASYTIGRNDTNYIIELKQQEMEILVAVLSVLVKQNREEQK